MKVLLFYALFVTVNSEFDPKSFDWYSVKPIAETKAYRVAYPWRFVNESLVEESRIFDRSGRIIFGGIIFS